MSLREQFEKIKHVWGAGTIWSPNEIRHWLQHPLVQERINAKITGGYPGDRFQYFLNRCLKGRLPVGRALTLGCGTGDLERGLSQYGFARIHEGIDLSDHAIQLARDNAAAAGLTNLEYRVADLNTLRLQPGKYDVIFGVSSIHHVEKLEHLLEQVRLALKPDGYVFLDEYIGPSRFQWTDKQLRIMNEELGRLPRELCRSVSEKGEVKDRVIRNTIEDVTAADPSEAVRSAEIVRLVSRNFKILELKGYGGSIIHELLYDIAGNFNESTPGSLDHLRSLFAVEDGLIASGDLADDFAVIIAEHRRVPA